MTVPHFPSATSPPYSLPLDAVSFRRALQQGHGRVVLHARHHGIDDRIEDVLHACLHNLVYDSLYEDDRGSWMIRLIDEAGAVSALAPRLIAEINEPLPDECQRRVVLRSLATRGYAEARDMLYRMFRKNEDSFSPFSCEQIIELDGADGLIHVCEKL